jgi:serine/threonine protein kinase
MIDTQGKGMVNNNYRISRRIGGGSFGEIYLGVGPQGDQVAVKFERVGTRCPQLRHEYKVYRELIGCHGFAEIRYFGNQDNYTVMAMDLLGPSIEDLFNKCKRKFTLKTVLQIADQMLERIDTMHSRHLVHRDIKPANFVIGGGFIHKTDHTNTIFAVDFGLSKRYRHPRNLQHMPHRDGRSLTGTPRYASINNHVGVEQSRRDDLESLAYVFIYLLNGSLPWQGLKAKNPQKKYRLIMEKKQEMTIQQLCMGIPREFGDILAYARGLNFDAKPDIPRLRKLLRECYHNNGCHQQPGTWDWDGMELGLGEKAGVPDDNDEADLELVQEHEREQEREFTGPPDGEQYDQRPTTSAAVAGGVGDGVRPGTAWYGGSPVPDDEEFPENKKSGHAAPISSGDGAPPTMPIETVTEGLGGMALAMARARDQGLISNAEAEAAGVPTASTIGGGGRSASNTAVVQGARAMMRYRRQRSPAGHLGEKDGGLYTASPQQPATRRAKTSSGKFIAGGTADQRRPMTSGDMGDANTHDHQGSGQLPSSRGVLSGSRHNLSNTSLNADLDQRHRAATADGGQRQRNLASQRGTAMSNSNSDMFGNDGDNGAKNRRSRNDQGSSSEVGRQRNTTGAAMGDPQGLEGVTSSRGRKNKQRGGLSGR